MSISENLKEAISTVHSTLSQLKSELMETNTQISGLTAKISHLLQMPISLEDWGVYLKSAIEKRGKSHLRYIQDALIPTIDYRGTHARNRQPLSYFDSDDVGQLFDLKLFPEQGSTLQAMCFFFPDVLHERVMARLKETIGTRWGNDNLPSVEERRKLIAEMEERRKDLEQKRAELEAQIDKISGALGG